MVSDTADTATAVERLRCGSIVGLERDGETGDGDVVAEVVVYPRRDRNLRGEGSQKCNDGRIDSVELYAELQKLRAINAWNVFLERPPIRRGQRARCRCSYLHKHIDEDAGCRSKNVRGVQEV